MKGQVKYILSILLSSITAKNDAVSFYVKDNPKIIKRFKEQKIIIGPDRYNLDLQERNNVIDWEMSPKKI